MGTTNATPNVTGTEENELFRQSFSLDIPKTLEGVNKVFTGDDGKVNEKALLLVVRAGMKQVSNNRLRLKVTEKDKDGKPVFQATDGTFNITSLLLEEPGRQILSQRDKLEKNLAAAGLPKATIDTMLATYDANVGTDTAAQGDISTETSEFSVTQGANGKLVMRAGRADDEE